MALMTIGVLSRRTGVHVKVLREYADAGLICSVERSPGNYRLFDEEALQCVGVIGALRAVGLTVAEIRQLSAVYLRESDRPVGPELAVLLQAARARAAARIADLQQLLERIGEFEAAHAAELAGKADFVPPILVPGASGA